VDDQTGELVPRAHVSVRTATVDDLPALVQLWQELRDLSPRRPRPGHAAETPEQRLQSVIDDPACRVVVAVLDDEPVGMAVLSRTWVSPLLDAMAVQVSLLVVSGQHRKHGVGRALVTAAVSYAEELDADEVVVSVLPHLREANRFYAQLGFSPQVMRRTASVTGLRRRLVAASDLRSVPDLARRRALLGPARVKAALRRADS
jgi:ribosomal protein S18 acetylase RimI-like enzyme